MSIFYLEWIHKRPSVCEFRDKIPEEYNFTSPWPVNLRQYKEIFPSVTIYGNINPDHYDYEYDSSPYTKRSYLVSHLQKSIRKMKHTKSVQTAKHLIDLDISSFLRRLPIIMFEDVIPHTSLPIIVWLMIAVSKGFKIKTVMVQWLLGVVYFLSSCKEHDPVKKIKRVQFEKIQLNPYLKSILLRISYGGMEGDMKMMNYFIELWSHRYQQGQHMNNTKINFINHRLEPLLRKDWDLCANDFHCNRQLIDQVKKQYDMFDEDYIKKLIWEHSSRANKRIQFEVNEDEHKDWLIIKKFVRFQQNTMEYY